MNEFPLAPEWAWNARIAVFPQEATLDDDLSLSQEEYDRRARSYAERGVNLVNATSTFHFRFDFIERFGDIAEVTRRITAACHRAGVKVYEHHSANLMSRHTDELYRGWNPKSALAVDIRSGEPSGLYGKLYGGFMCVNNPEFKENYAHYILDFIECTGVDGLMHDDIHFAGQYFCGCEHCREKFVQVMGYSLPECGAFPLDDYSDPLWRDWLRFRLISTADQIRELRGKLPGDFLLFSCMSAGALGEADVHHAGASMETFALGTNCIFSENGNLSWRNKGSRHPRNFYANWEKLFVEKKYIQAICDSFCQPALDMHYPANPKEGFFCWALTKTFGHCLWRCDPNVYGGGTGRDEFRDWEPEFDYFNWERQNQSLFRFPKSLNEIGIAFSQRTKLNLGIDPRHHAECWAGWMQALQRAGFVADGLIDRDLEDMDRLRSYRLIVLPNVVCLSQKAAANLKEYVRSGGNLIATHQTGLRDEKGRELGDFVLAELFGCRFWRLRAGEKISWFADRRFAGEPLFSDVPLRLSCSPGLMVSWEGETPDRKVLGWSEKTALYHEEPQSPAMIRSRFGTGTVFYLAPQVGALAYRQGLFPLWALGYHRQRFVEDDERGRRVLWWETPEDRNASKWLFVDEGLDGYRRLIGNLVSYLLPGPSVRVRAPQGLLFNCFVQSKAPADYSGSGNLVVGLVNVAGAGFEHGQEIAPPTRVHYPGLEGDLEIVSRRPVRRATCFSPDSREPLPVEIVQAGANALLRLGLQNFRRVGFILMEIGQGHN